MTARIPKLNWDESRRKWTVVYRGKKFRFDGGTGKSDREAKNAAEASWRAVKVQLDGEAIVTKPHHDEYAQAIREWSFVLCWSNEQKDETNANVARDKISRLEEQFKKHVPKRLLPDDFVFDPSGDRFRFTVEDASPNFRPLEVLSPPGQRGGYDPDSLWRDRLRWHAERTSSADSDDSYESNVKMFLDGKREEFEAGEISASRVDFLRSHLDVVMEFAGRATPVKGIDGTTLYSFRQHLLTKRTSGDFAAYTARDVLAAFKQFIRWLVSSTDKLEYLPKNIDEKSMSISVPRQKAKTLPKPTVQKLVKEATDRTRLYLLLGMNCAMTQIDMSDLQHDEVDWSNGVITRKRSKTQDVENVLTVSYSLWPSTFALLRSERSDDPLRVLLTQDGRPLRTDRLTDAGKIQKTDAISLAVRWLSKRLKIPFSMKAMKKTAASLLRTDPRYKGIETLFLDHAPSTVAERHYTAIPQELLNEAVAWIGRELAVDKTNSGD